MDPAEIRRKNFIQPTSSRTPTTSAWSYDSGDYEGALDKALEIVGYDDAPQASRRRRRKEGRYLGIGLSTWIEICGFGPSAATAAARPAASRWSNRPRCGSIPTGSVAGLRRHPRPRPGPRHDLRADRRGHARACRTTSIEMRHGDTAEGPAFGYGTYGSRSLAVGGMAVRRRRKKIVDKAQQDRRAHARGGRRRRRLRPGPVPRQGQPGQRARRWARSPSRPIGARPAGGHGARPRGRRLLRSAQLRVAVRRAHRVVEVDPRPASVDLQQYIAVDDCGNVINPMIVEGQMHGGIAQGIAQALFEEVVYDRDRPDDDAARCIDYLVPTANEIPNARARPNHHPVADQRAWRQGHRRGRHDRRSAPQSSMPSATR